MAPAFVSLMTIAAVVAALLAFLGLTTVLGQRYGLHPELKRKILHTGLGLSALAFPFLFHRLWEMGLLCAILLIVLFVVRRLPALKSGLGSSLHGVERVSFGEVFFVLAVLALYVLARDRLVLYVVPLIILTLSDAAAALVGVRYGKRAFDVVNGKKSLEGMLAFFGVTFVSVALCLYGLADLPVDVIVLTAFLLAVLGALTEAVLWHGLDNIFVPLGGYLLLSYTLDAQPGELIAAAIALILLTGLALASRRFSQLNTHALMMAMICAAILWLVGGIAWVSIALVIFGVHVAIVGWLHKDDGVYTIEAVFCVASSAMIWLTVWQAYRYEDAFFLYCLAMAIHIQVNLLLRLKAHRQQLAGPVEVTIAAFLSGGAMMALYMLFAGPTQAHVVRAGLVIVALAVGGMLTRVTADRFTRSRWVAQASFALFGSLLGWVILESTGL
ncbi:hypothetical protein ABAC402_08195 [Asticcacaulis sp. AC402]|nr:hypothetical protein ABAC402_08195 [Asticcacaulis sp. AC402]